MWEIIVSVPSVKIYVPAQCVCMCISVRVCVCISVCASVCGRMVHKWG